jgi:hypothetical protein
VIVVGKPQARGFAMRGEFVADIGDVLPLVDGGAQLRIHPRHHQPLVTGGQRLVDGLLRIVDEGDILNVRAWRCHAEVDDHLLDLGRRMAEIAGELHFLVADIGDFLQRAGNIFLHLRTDGVELDAGSAVAQGANGAHVLVPRGECVSRHCGKSGSGSPGRQHCASRHQTPHVITPSLRISTAWFAARAESAM